VTLSQLLANPHLPTPPAVALQLIELASKPDCQIKQLVTLLSQDPGLCGKLLQTVNSSLYQPARPVTSLERAVIVLGLKPLRSLVLGLSLSSLQPPKGAEDVWRYWQESVVGAVIVRELALLLKRPQPEDDLVAGLVRDLGILVLRQAFTARYMRLRGPHAGDWFTAQCAAERGAFGLDHAEVTAALLQSWNLPPEIVLPVRYHHEPAQLTNGPRPIQERAWLLAFGSKLALLDVHTPQTIRELLELAQAHFGMSQQTLIRFLGSMMPRIQEFAGLLKVDIGKCPNFASIIAAGSTEFVRLSVDSGGSAQHAELISKEASNITPRRPPSTVGLNQTVVSNQGSRALSGSDASGRGAPATMMDFDLGCLNELPAGVVRLDGYELKDIIGRGAMGVIFKAYDPLLRRYAAVKMLSAERLVSSEARERFMREARAAAAIQHPNVVTIYGIHEVHGIYYLVMEYVAGGSLEDEIDRDGALPIARVATYGRQLAAGLQAAHARRVVHRDVKPANVLLDRQSGLLKITDFGLSRALDDGRISQAGTWVGTPLYMAPEQFAGSGVDHRADLFSLGCVLYVLCTGRPPFQGDSLPAIMNQVCNTPHAPVEQLRREVPSWLSQLINTLLTKSPADRMSSAAAAVAVFDRHAMSRVQ
jgi:HD-like signal output (HDOD) protein/tRNA A-37 threonylcarbamoyl transferase component Bud32